MTKRICNVGGVDRSARLGLASMLVGLAVLKKIKGHLRIIAGILGVLGLLSGIMRYCPISKILGRNTCEQKPEPLDEDRAEKDDY